MQPCVIYARVSTKEQQDEGFSIPAQLKAIRAFCAEEGLSPVAEFVEAESAGKAGRKELRADARLSSRSIPTCAWWSPTSSTACIATSTTR